MGRWFLSYHSPDEKLAAGLKSAVEGKDPALDVFFAPTHLRAGGAWTAQLAQEIAAASAFILLVLACQDGQRICSRSDSDRFSQTFFVRTVWYRRAP